MENLEGKEALQEMALMLMSVSDDIFVKKPSHLSETSS